MQKSTVFTAIPSFQQQLQISLNNKNEHSPHSNTKIPRLLQIAINNTKEHTHDNNTQLQPQLKITIYNK